ncbi:hypothetical protein M2280_005029 [Prescottella agglutinans]|uniref:Uncharacterized protein n=1 Tax=Prescottella agglutinans TaxID=1644129 RepID=A0ABT6MHI4_9NOCA|nr:hypothetical protein [Prescottella agglutinans]
MLASAPSGLVAWVSSFSRLSSPDDAVWFLSLADYTGSSTDAFAWNEFETMSRDATPGAADEAAVAEFWSRHCPILLSVRDDYSYLAARVDGTIVRGEEPEFENTTEVAVDLDSLLVTIATRSGPGVALIEGLLFGSR